VLATRGKKPTGFFFSGSQNYAAGPFPFCSFTSTVVTGLSPGHDYEFRVYAENVYGRSLPSEPSSIVRTKELLKKPPKTNRYEGNKNKKYVNTGESITVLMINVPCV